VNRQALAAFALAVVTTLAAGTRPAAQQQPPAPSPSSSRSSSASPSRAVLNQYCVPCHNVRLKTAGLALDVLDLAEVGQHALVWEKVVRKLRAGMMPPPGAPRPGAGAYASLIGWLENELDRTAAPHLPPPGLHRLNRTEYANVVRDLLDLEITASKYLPSDDSTHGFDNIAGTLGISSTLVEAYVSAAEKISRLALGAAEQPTLAVYRAPEDTSQDYYIEGLPFGTRGGMLVKHLFPSDGDYTVTVTPIFGDNMTPAGFGSIPCEQLEISLDRERLALMDWQGGGRAPAANCRGRRTAETRSGQAGPEAFFGGRDGKPMRVRFAASAGQHTLGVTFLQTNLAPVLDLDQHFARSTVQTGPTPGYTFFPHVGTVRIEGPHNARPAQDSPSRRKILVCRPMNSAGEPACARRIAANLATRAFRRPATAAEIGMLMDFYHAGRTNATFDQGIEMMLARILASPQFLYRIEKEPADLKPGDSYSVSDNDLASRLSFFLWSSSPDDELIRLAGRKQLRDPSALEEQVRRMLRDPRSAALAANFAGQWLNLRGLESVGPLPMLYPDFDDPLRQAMRREVELLFESVIREDRDVSELLTAGYTFVNERLARHYGIPFIYGSQFRRVTLGDDLDARRGLLGKGAILTTTSKPDRTSPVTRGKWIMTNILGMSPPDPPPNVPPLKPRSNDATGNAPDQTMRQKMLQHRVRADCAQCHRLMDPIGFALENFDAIAAWRTDDEGARIDASTEVFDSTRIDGPVALRRWLAGYSSQFVAVVAEKLLTYALGRGVEYQDMPEVRSIVRAGAARDNRFSALVLAIVKSRPFQMNMSVDPAVARNDGASR